MLSVIHAKYPRTCFQTMTYTNITYYIYLWTGFGSCIHRSAAKPGGGTWKSWRAHTYYNNNYKVLLELVPHIAYCRKYVPLRRRKTSILRVVKYTAVTYVYKYINLLASKLSNNNIIDRYQPYFNSITIIIIIFLLSQILICIMKTYATDVSTTGYTWYSKVFSPIYGNFTRLVKLGKSKTRACNY